MQNLTILVTVVPEISLGPQNKNASRDPDHAPFKGGLSSVCWDFIQPACVQKIDHSIFSRSDDIIGAYQNLKGSRDLTTSLSGMICHQWARTCY